MRGSRRPTAHARSQRTQRVINNFHHKSVACIETFGHEFGNKIPDRCGARNARENGKPRSIPAQHPNRPWTSKFGLKKDKTQFYLGILQLDDEARTLVDPYE